MVTARFLADITGPQGGQGPVGTPWVKGLFPQNTTLGFNRDPGLYVIPNAVHAETVTGLPESYPCLILEEQVPEGSAIIRRETVIYYNLNRTYTRVTGSGGTWLPWQIRGGDMGLAPAGYDLNTLRAGQIALTSPNYTSVLNRPSGAGPGLCFTLESSVFTIMRAQGYFEYGGAGGQGGKIWARTVMDVSGNYGPWIDLTGGGASGPTNVGLANSLLLDEFTGAMGGVHYTGGVGAAAVRIDHGLNNFNLLVRPLLEARGIPYCIALSSRRWDQEENNAVTPAMVDSWVAGGLCEIWNHGALAHNNATGLSAITDYWVTGKAELETQLPSAKIYGAILPGTGESNAFDGLGGASTPKMVSGSTGGQVILGSHAVMAGAFSGTDLRVIDGNVRQGQWHYTMDARTPAAIISKIGEAKSTKKGLQLMLHPSLVDTSGFITQAQLTEVLDHIAAERDANRLRVFSPYKMMLADSSR